MTAHTDRTRKMTASRVAWVGDRVQRKKRRWWHTADVDAAAEREWAKRHPAMAKVLAGAVA